MKNLKELIKQVEADWQEAFPSLTRYSKNKYYKVLGPVLVGIELVSRTPFEQYSPHFVIYSLLGNKTGKDLKSCLSAPIILFPFIDKNRREIQISYANHEFDFPTLLEQVKNQLPFSIDDEASLKDLFLVFDEQSKLPPLSHAPNSYLQASLMESKLEIAICFGSDKIVQEAHNEIKQRNWDIAHFELWGVKYEEWLDSIDKKIVDKVKILSRLNINKNDKRLEKLNKSTLG